MPLKVQGLREFLQATDRASRDTKRLVREELKEAAEPVRAEAERRFMRVNPVSAEAYRVSIRRAGVVLVQSSKRKTTGTRPDYGALQMRIALVPAADAKKREVEDRMERAVDRISDRVNGGW